MEADEIMEYRVGQCQKWGSDLSECRQWEVGRHQVLDLPAIQPIVREGRRYQVNCQCKHRRALWGLNSIASSSPSWKQRGDRDGLFLRPWPLSLMDNPFLMFLTPRR